MRLLGIALLCLASFAALVLWSRRQAGAPESVRWPPLPTTTVPADRVATQADVQAGVAAFAAVSPDGTPATRLSITVPQYAYHVDEASGERTPVVIIQAEQAGDLRLIGYRDLDGETGAGLLQEFELLGATLPGRR